MDQRRNQKINFKTILNQEKMEAQYAKIYGMQQKPSEEGEFLRINTYIKKHSWVQDGSG